MSDTSRTDRALWLTVVLLIGVSVWLRTTDLGLLSEEMVCFYNPISSVGTSGVNNLLGSHN
ncbi:MAG: hypothetical protein IIA30_13755 [Myxococcales bacterium]|nr:hypothetical protein [Myxococcales bacterium]